MISFLARSTAGRIAIIPALVCAGAWSWLTYLMGTSDPFRKSQLADSWGYLGAGMAPHWARLADRADPEYLSAFHSLKNIGSEWARLDPQRAYKAGCFLLIGVSIAAFAGGLLIGLTAG